LDGGADEEVAAEGAGIHRFFQGRVAREAVGDQVGDELVVSGTELRPEDGGVGIPRIAPCGLLLDQLARYRHRMAPFSIEMLARLWALGRPRRHRSSTHIAEIILL